MTLEHVAMLAILAVLIAPVVAINMRLRGKR